MAVQRQSNNTGHMMKQVNFDEHQAELDNQLDIRGLFCALWAGKRWVGGVAILFALCALIYSFLVTQEWSATAITDKPAVNTLSRFYSQQRFLQNLDNKAEQSTSNQPLPTDAAYKEFVMQLASWDTRRAFWQQTDYYKQRQTTNSKNNAVLLDELINNIQFTPGDTLKNLNDSIRLIAETAPDANNLLRQYVAFASQRAAHHLNDELKGAWAARTVQMQSQIKRQEAVAKAVYERKLSNVKQALKIAQAQNITQKQSSTPVDEMPASELFLLGRPVLQAQLENLQATGPEYDLDYDRNRAMLSTLEVGPVLEDNFQTYRYLRTPEDPVKRDSPQRVFLLVMWGVIGALTGAGIALARRKA